MMCERVFVICDPYISYPCIRVAANLGLVAYFRNEAMRPESARYR
jgi:hypothetical protein